MLSDELHRPTQRPLLRRRVRRARPAHRKGAPTMASGRPRPRRSRSRSSTPRARITRPTTGDRRTDHRGDVSARNVDATQTTPSQSHDRIPVRLVPRALHHTSDRRHPAAPSTRRPSRAPVPTTGHHRRPTPRRARTQDDPRSAHDRPGRARPRNRTPTRRPQRRHQRTTQTPTRRRPDRPVMDRV
jgi:hypothetical protein